MDLFFIDSKEEMKRDHFNHISTVHGLISHSSNECKNILFVMNNQYCSLETFIDELDLRAYLSLNTLNINHSIVKKNIKDDINLQPQTTQYLLDGYTEAINNIAKHSCAKTVRIILSHKKNKVTLSVTDDGIGFDYVLDQKNNNLTLLKSDKKKTSYGLSLMMEYSLKLNAIFSIQSKSGRGTTFKLSIENE